MIVAHFLFAFTVVFSANPTFAKPIETCSTAPQYFTINEFTTFAPSSTNTRTERISFFVGSTSCSSSTVLNPETPKVCNDIHFDYLWDGTSLTVSETYTPCANVTARIQTSGQISKMALYCYPVEPPYPLGYGTLCETPTGQVTGDFTKNTTLH